MTVRIARKEDTRKTMPCSTGLAKLVRQAFTKINPNRMRVRRAPQAIIPATPPPRAQFVRTGTHRPPTEPHPAQNA